MKKETSSERIRKAIKRIKSKKADSKEESIEELERKFNLKKKQLEKYAEEESKWINDKLDFMRELTKVNEKLDNLDLKLERIKQDLPIRNNYNA